MRHLNSTAVATVVVITAFFLVRSSAGMMQTGGRPDARAVAAPAAADEPSEKPFEIPEAEKPFWESAQAFVDTYAARDANALGDLFTEDAEFYDEFGVRTQGRAAIVEMFKSVFEESPNALVQEIRIDQVRFITDSVVLEDGIVVSSAGDPDDTVESHYVALHRKGDDGRWRLNTVKDFPSSEADRQNELSQLSWLLGDWVNEDSEAVVHTSCSWSEDGNYLLKEFVVQTFDGGELSGVQRIGWDAGNKRIRSWTFDSRGGFTSGHWIHSGNDWIVTFTGTTADGEAVTGTAVHTPVDAELLIWQYRDLVIGDEFRGTSEPVRMVRRPPAPAE